MSDFQLDTSGSVDQPHLYRALRWFDLTPFCQGALEAALREYHAEACEQADDYGQPHPAPDRFGFRHLAPATLARFIADCKRAQASSCTSAVDSDPFEFGNSEEDGDNFWNTRTKGWLSGFPPLTLCLADDGLIHARDAA